MELTKEFLIKQFNILNKEFFNGELPSIEIKISRTKNVFGKYMFKLPCFANGYKEVPMSISISKFWIRTRKEYIETLMHEMIHYYLSYKMIGRTEDPHGYHFQKMMREINNKSDYNISIRSSSNGKQSLNNANGKKSVIVVFEYNNKKYFSKIAKTLQTKSAIESKFSDIRVIKFIETSSVNVEHLKLRTSRLSLIEASKENFKKYGIVA